MLGVLRWVLCCVGEGMESVQAAIQAAVRGSAWDPVRAWGILMAKAAGPDACASVGSRFPSTPGPSPRDGGGAAGSAARQLHFSPSTAPADGPLRRRRSSTGVATPASSRSDNGDGESSMRSWFSVDTPDRDSSERSGLAPRSVDRTPRSEAASMDVDWTRSLSRHGYDSPAPALPSAQPASAESLRRREAEESDLDFLLDERDAWRKISLRIGGHAPVLLSRDAARKLPPEPEPEPEPEMEPRWTPDPVVREMRAEAAQARSQGKEPSWFRQPEPELEPEEGPDRFTEEISESEAMSWMAMRVEQDQIAQLVEDTEGARAGLSLDPADDDNDADGGAGLALGDVAKAGQIKERFAQLAANYTVDSPVKDLSQKATEFKARMAQYIQPSYATAATASSKQWSMLADLRDFVWYDRYQLPTDAKTMATTIAELKAAAKLAEELGAAGMAQKHSARCRQCLEEGLRQQKEIERVEKQKQKPAPAPAPPPAPKPPKPQPQTQPQPQPPKPAPAPAPVPQPTGGPKSTGGEQEWRALKTFADGLPTAFKAHYNAPPDMPLKQMVAASPQIKTEFLPPLKKINVIKSALDKTVTSVEKCSAALAADLGSVPPAAVAVQRFLGLKIAKMILNADSEKPADSGRVDVLFRFALASLMARLCAKMQQVLPELKLLFIAELAQNCPFVGARELSDPGPGKDPAAYFEKLRWPEVAGGPNRSRDGKLRQKANDYIETMRTRSLIYLFFLLELDAHVGPVRLASPEVDGVPLLKQKLAMSGAEELWVHLARTVNLGLRNGAADRLDANGARKTFSAVPVVLKDIVEYGGWKILECYVSQPHQSCRFCAALLCNMARSVQDSFWDFG